MNLKIKKILKVIIPLLFGGALVWYLFTIIPPETLLEYFKNANVCGADVDRRILFEDQGIWTFYVDQTNPKTIEELWNSFEDTKFDIIVDEEKVLQLRERKKIFMKLIISGDID